MISVFVLSQYSAASRGRSSQMREQRKEKYDKFGLVVLSLFLPSLTKTLPSSVGAEQPLSPSNAMETRLMRKLQIKCYTKYFWTKRKCFPFDTIPLSPGSRCMWLELTRNDSGGCLNQRRATNDFYWIDYIMCVSRPKAWPQWRRRERRWRRRRERRKKSNVEVASRKTQIADANFSHYLLKTIWILHGQSIYSALFRKRTTKESKVHAHILRKLSDEFSENSIRIRVRVLVVRYMQAGIT